MSGEYRTLRTQPKIGRILQQARQERGLSLEEVEQATKIRARYLMELERENLAVLPDVYARGFLKTYADYLQLDGKALVRKVKDQQASWPHEQNPTRGESLKGSPDPPLILPGIPPVGAEGRRKAATEELAGPPALVSAGSNYRAYLVSFAALLIFAVAAVALTLALVGDKRQAVSQVREPVVNPVAPIGGGEVELTYQPQHEDDRRGAGYESNNPQPKEKNTGPKGADVEDYGAGRAGQSGGQAQSAPLRAQNSREAAAALSAPMPDDASTVPTPEASLQRRPQKTMSPPPAVSPAPKLVPAIKARLFRRPTSAAMGRPGIHSRDGGDFDVRIKVGGNDPVRITRSPVNDR